jgi:hypothetical protein
MNRRFAATALSRVNFAHTLTDDTPTQSVSLLMNRAWMCGHKSLSNIRMLNQLGPDGFFNYRVMSCSTEERVHFQA